MSTAAPARVCIAPMARHAVIVGALGIIGRALIDRLTSDPEWDVVGLSRRAPGRPPEHASLAWVSTA